MNESIHEQMKFKHRALKGEQTAGVRLDAGSGPQCGRFPRGRGSGTERPHHLQPWEGQPRGLGPPDPTTTLGKGRLSGGGSGVHCALKAAGAWDGQPTTPAWTRV